jgi:hypothetical protein
MTHHNQTKELTTWFLNLPLDESIDNKGTKFKFQIQDPIKHNKETKKLRKAQEGHLEEGKPQKPTKGTKGRKIMKKARKAQNQSKSSRSSLSLKLTPPNTLNANSPP